MVEDNGDMAETFGVAPALDGHSVRTVPDGPAALRAVDDFDPDVVLLDVESKLAGCDAHLVKPVDPDVLRRILADDAGGDHPPDDRKGPLTTARR